MKKSIFRLINSFLLLILLPISSLLVVDAIKFDLQAHPESSAKQKCITQYVPTDTLVVVTIKVGIGYNQQINVEVTDNSPAHNEYGRKRDVNEETRIAFTTHVEADVSVCFTNILEEGKNQQT